MLKKVLESLVPLGSLMGGHPFRLGNRFAVVAGLLSWVVLTWGVMVAAVEAKDWPTGWLHYANSGVGETLAKTACWNHQPLRPAAMALANRPPEFTITPDVRQLTVGTQVTVEIRFRDPDNDAFLGAAIAVNARLDFETTPLKPRQQDRLAPVKIEALPSSDPTVLVWQITAQQPGTAIMFISISELFTRTLPNGQIRLQAGEIQQTAYALQIIDPQTPSPASNLAPQLQDPLPDLKLRVGESAQITLNAVSPAARPLHYGMLFLAYASRLLEGRFAGVTARTQAIEPGQGIFVAYATDGQQTAVRTFRYQVLEMNSSPSTTMAISTTAATADAGPQLRHLSVNTILGRNRKTKIVLYGENFSADTQVLLQPVDAANSPSTAGWLLPAQLLSSEQLAVTIISEQQDQFLSGLMRLIVMAPSGGATNAGSSQLIRFLPPIITDVNVVRDDQQRPQRLQIIGLGIGRQHLVQANGRKLKILAQRSFTSRFGDLLVVALPRSFNMLSTLTLEVSNVRTPQRQQVVLPLQKLR